MFVTQLPTNNHSVCSVIHYLDYGSGRAVVWPPCIGGRRERAARAGRCVAGGFICSPLRAAGPSLSPESDVWPGATRHTHTRSRLQYRHEHGCWAAYGHRNPVFWQDDIRGCFLIMFATKRWPKVLLLLNGFLK